MLCVPPMSDKSSMHFVSFVVLFLGDICEEVILYSSGGLFAARLFSEIFSVIYVTGKTLVWGVNPPY